MVVAAGVLFAIPPSTYAVSTDLQLEIDGIECDLEALYGGNDPSTVTIPSYCNNAPEPPETTDPDVSVNPGIPVVTQPNKPVVPSYGALLLESSLQPSTIEPIQNTGGIGGVPTPALPNPDEEIVPLSESMKIPTSFVEVTIIIAAIVSIALVLSIAASGFFGTRSHKILTRIKAWLSKLHR